MTLPPPRPGSTCLVTGASSGIGRELARGLARRGHGVTLVARRHQRLEELAEELRERAQVRAEAIECDLSDPESRERMIRAVDDLGLEVEVLVNSAGLGTGGLFKDLDAEAETRMIRVNCESVVALCHAYAPVMARRGRGGILNVASIAGYAPLPRQSTYAATKSFVLIFSHALHVEMKRLGVTVTTLCPGPTNTEFGAASGEQVQSVMESLPGFMTSVADEVAETGLRALERGQRHVTHGMVNKVNALSAYFAPRPLELALMGRFYPVRE